MLGGLWHATKWSCMLHFWEATPLCIYQILHRLENNLLSLPQTSVESCLLLSKDPPFALLCSHNCSVSVLEVCIVRPSFLHQWPLLLLKYSLGQRLCSQCCHSFGRNLMLAFSMLGTAKCHAPWSWLANHLNLHIKLSISAHIDFSGANYTFKFSKEAKIIRLGLRALSFWRVNEYVKLIVLEKATNPHPQLKRELMIFALIPEVNQKKVGASAQHTDRRVKFTLT